MGQVILDMEIYFSILAILLAVVGYFGIIFYTKQIINQPFKGGS